MEIIELLSCLGCQRIIDQIKMRTEWRCQNCYGKFFKEVSPTKWVLLRWFLGNPKHVWSLLKQDIREKYHDRKKC